MLGPIKRAAWLNWITQLFLLCWDPSQAAVLSCNKSPALSTFPKWEFKCNPSAGWLPFPHVHLIPTNKLLKEILSLPPVSFHSVPSLILSQEMGGKWLFNISKSGCNEGGIVALRPAHSGPEPQKLVLTPAQSGFPEPVNSGTHAPSVFHYNLYSSSEEDSPIAFLSDAPMSTSLPQSSCTYALWALTCDMLWGSPELWPSWIQRIKVRTDGACWSALLIRALAVSSWLGPSPRSSICLGVLLAFGCYPACPTSQWSGLAQWNVWPHEKGLTKCCPTWWWLLPTHLDSGQMTSWLLDILGWLLLEYSPCCHVLCQPALPQALQAFRY